MIGPHEGKELELMLKGQKHLALFSDLLLPDQPISEEIIPEKQFAPYVGRGQIGRICEDLKAKNGDVIRYVFFFTPEHEWRAKTIIWLKQQIFDGTKKFDYHNDLLIGRLLGYSEEDIANFLDHQAATLKLYQHNQGTERL